MAPAKHDQGKPIPLHVPTQILHDIMEVRGYGVKKYNDPENWRTLELDRLINALLRHTLAFWENPYAVDEESRLAHYKHMACNLAFICEMMKEKENECEM